MWDKQKQNDYNKKYYLLHKEGLNEKNKKYNKEYRKLNKDKIKIYNEKIKIERAEQILESKKKYILNNPLKRKESQKKYRDSHRGEINEKLKEKLNKNSKYKFEFNTRTLIRNSFRRRRFKKESTTAKILGCDMKFFFSYIENLFEQGMSFENYGKWHIDHIIPLSTAINEKEIIKLNYYTNLRPLWAEENLKKSYQDKLLGKIVRVGKEKEVTKYAV